MNVSFNPYHLGNTYGAFGSIGRIRLEVVIEGTDEPEITEHTVWKEYGFKGKPGDPHRLPRQWAPYHLRLDWLMWFAALSPALRAGLARPVRRAAAAERSADAAAASAQSVPRLAAAVCAGAALRVPVHHVAGAVARARVVASHPGR